MAARQVSGSGRMRLDEEIHDVGVWDVIRVAPEVVRAFEAGPDGLELIAVGGSHARGRRRRAGRDALAVQYVTAVGVLISRR